MQITTAAAEAAVTGKQVDDVVAERAAARRVAELGQLDRDILPSTEVLEDFARGFDQVDFDLLNLGLDPEVDALVERLSVLATPLRERERRWALATGRVGADVVPIPTMPARHHQEAAA